MFKKNHFIFLAVLIVAMMSVAVAADVDDSTTESAAPAVTHTTDNTVVKTAPQTSNEITKKVDTNTKESVLDEPKTINVTSANYDTVFGPSGLDSNVNNGDTIDVQDSFVYNSAVIINKAVNITSTTNAVISLNTTSGSYTGNETGNSFNIINTGSFTNITNINFYNTQIFVKNANHVTFDNVNITVNNQKIGSGVGVLSIRENSTYVTVKNSYIHTCNNSGSSSIVLAQADYCTIDNNTIIGEGNVGNLVYLTTYNIPNVLYTDVNTNTYNNITNNRISTINLSGGVCVGVVVSGHSNKFEGNNVSVASSFSGQWISPYANLTGDFNDTYEGNSYINNKVYGSFTGTKNSTITDNKFNKTVTLPERCIFKNNNAENSTVTVKGKNCDLCGNTINTLVVSAYPVYVCTDNIFTNYPTDPNISWYTHGSRSDTLNKNYLRSVKTSSVTDGIEYNEVDIDDEETFLKYFRYQENGGLYLPIANYITGNTRYKLGYFPENGKMLYFMSNMLGTYMKNHFSIVGKDGFTLNNVGFYIIGIHVSISNLNLNYNLEDEENPVNPIHCQSMGMAAVTDAYVEFDHLNITLKSVYKASTQVFNLNPAQVNDNDIIQNSIINVEVPAGSYNIINNKASNVTIFNNTINVKEIDAVGENPSIIAINGLDSTNVTCISNNITMNGKSTLTAIKLNSNTNTITNNNITVTSTKGTATGVELNGNDNTVTDNTIKANKVYGNDAVTVTGENNVVKDNKPFSTSLKVIAPENANINEKTPITIILKDNTAKLMPAETITVKAGDNEAETVTTDEDGIAVYNLTATQSGELNLTITYEGKGDYAESTINVTVNVYEDKDAIIEELNNSLKGNASALEKATEKINELENNITALEGKISDLTKALNGNVTALENANKEIEELNNNVTALNDKITTQENTIKTLNNSLTSANDKITTQENTIKTLNNSLTSANDKITTQENTIKSLNNSLADADKKIASQQDSINALSNQISKALSQIDAQTKTIDDLTKKFNNSTATINSLINRANNLTQLNKQLTEKIKNLTRPKTKVNTKVTLVTNTTSVGKNVKITGTLTDANSKALGYQSVTLTINKATVNVGTNAKGKYTYTYTPTTPGTYNVTAKYTGNDNYKAASTTKKMKVTKATPTVKIVSIGNSLKVNDIATFTVLVTDSSSKNINTGKVSFKINGKTLTNSKGQAVIVNVAKGVATYKFRIPNTYSSQKYTLTAVYLANDNYNEVRKNSTFTVVKTNTHIEASLAKTSGKTATIKAEILDENNKATTGTTKVTIKVNGKTVKDQIAVKNGKISTKIDTSKLDKGVHNVEIIAGVSGRYQSSRTTTLLQKV